jgi:uncharacterized membrane protein YidH (DUF202 family)
MDKDKLQTISTFLVTIALLALAYRLVQQAIDLARESDRVSPETLTAGIFALANAIVIGAIARWLQQGVQQSAERTAERTAEAVVTAAATAATTVANGSTTAENVQVQGEDVTVTEKP